MKKIFKFLLTLFFLFALIIISFDSLIGIYSEKEWITKKFNQISPVPIEKLLSFFSSPPPIRSLNDLALSDRQLPPTDIKDLSINEDAHLIGQWSSPFDWNLQSVHAILLPDQTVMTFGSYGVEKREDINTKQNKEITLTDGRVIQRDYGSLQWKHHDPNAGVDFNIWEYQKGIKQNSQKLYKKPVSMDAFCSVARIIDQDSLFILGGGKHEHDKSAPDSLNASMIYSIKDRSFRKFKNLLRKRWYGSAVITGDRKLILLGGIELGEGNSPPSTTPEIIDLNNLEDGFKLLKEADSNSFFGREDSDEWNYPRAFLTSDGNIVGISYNKLWVMDAKNQYRIQKTGEIPLETGGIKENIRQFDPVANKYINLQLMTIGAPVGSTNNVLMHDKDKILVFGGQQLGDEYLPSNKIYEIDFSDSFNPKIKKLHSSIYPRSNANSIFLADGRVFINGGHSFQGQNGVFNAEIYDIKLEESTLVGQAQMRRNYHSTSTLLPDGRVLTSGGDVWNSEIYYPPYFFMKNENNKTVLAPRPKLLIPNQTEIIRGNSLKVNFSGDISKLLLISSGSVTHAQGSESKIRNIAFKKLNDNKLEFIIDKNPNNLQDGYYLLFGLNEAGVPSVGKFVYVN